MLAQFAFLALGTHEALAGGAKGGKKGDSWWGDTPWNAGTGWGSDNRGWSSQRGEVPATGATELYLPWRRRRGCATETAS